jgi:predicted dehydrogenase
MAKARTIGIIGLGSIGIRHKNNLWQELDQTEVVGYDPDPSKLNGAGWVIGDLTKMIEMSDLIIIASPTPLHAKHIEMCKGKKLFVEKPVAHALPIDVSDVVMVGYNLRFHSCVKQAKAWLDDGWIGQPIWANFTLGQHSDKPPYLRDGVILNWSHEIDLALHLLGPWGFDGSRTRLVDGRDDLTDIMLNQSGCRTTIHLDYLTKPEVRQVIIVGTKATIILDLLARHAWLRDLNGDMVDTLVGIDSWNENYIEELKAFLDRCEGGQPIDESGCDSGCTGDEGVEVLKICSKVRKDAGL